MSRIVIAGMGNVLLSDDGLGPYVIEQLAAHYAFGPEVELLDIGTPALDFLLYFANADLLLVIDAVRSSAPPGTLLRFSREDILRHHAPLRLDSHSPALGHALQFGAFADVSPRDVLLVGIAVENTETGTRLSESVRTAIPALIEMIAGEIRLKGVSAVKFEVPGQVRIWWETAA